MYEETENYRETHTEDPQDLYEDTAAVTSHEGNVARAIYDYQAGQSSLYMSRYIFSSY